MGTRSDIYEAVATAPTRRVMLVAAALLSLLVVFAAAGDTAFAKSKSSFSGTGYIGAAVPVPIDVGDVTPAGNSGRFVVKDRTVAGFVDPFDAPFSTPLWGEFSATFGTNVPITTQSGNIHGDLSLAFGAYDANLVAKTSPIALSLETFPIGVDGSGNPIIARIGGLAIEGKMTFTSGTQGRGELGGEFWVFLDSDTNHILSGAPAGIPFTNIVTGVPTPGLSGLSTIGLSGTWHQ